MWEIASGLWGIASVLWEDTFSTVEVVQYSGRIISVQWGRASVLWSVFSTFGRYLQYMQGITLVQWGNNISAMEGIQYSGEIISVQWGDNISTVGDNINTVEIIQYSGDKDLKYYEFSKNLDIFSRTYFASQSDRPYSRPQVLTTADMVKDLWYENLVLSKIPL